MQITHHLTDALLMAFSAGTLSEAFSLVVATHVTMCDDCRARLAAYDAIGGAVLDNAETAALSPDALAVTLAQIDTLGPEPAPRPAPRGGTFPAPLHDYVGGDLDAVKWRAVGGGVRQSLLATGGQATARLLYIPAGVSVPNHSHRGTELTLVLQGAFRDEVDRFARGDVEVSDDSLTHTPQVDPGADCICLAATDARLKFTGLLPRLAQPFLGI